MAEPSTNPWLSLGMQLMDVARQKLATPAEPVVPVEVTVEDPDEPASVEALQERLTAIAARLHLTSKRRRLSSCDSSAAQPCARSCWRAP